ncbi:UDP-4-amino-4,6-dideoxy-N-acetyl-beta-L-altrosamine transaminase [Aquibacillus koreensis]|uniref:UDP-4-amino-4, 6-dideoxy-N-acetyl-beta-L-altrosamine transaminase n=1 Tax=Aquibacillus koreensis TaxID=279446 RepID=A0A9X4AKF9_9BACI|nr:UDP-4-amino-4,6-dideoxy-N-acetyl-beta-L-altrosamine transaminase [Aquibacillus koreensis]MCT2536291.1 UDP-4-amino-4,6-dideoxy-N-acetyl-beta-L-altrosamine transaminase [Aquibacillus koreensis]MDC3421358.1 UDP-4-amino-4,6-dideoxy-N-acetyl-beta-L-altrosamine transaminase [Aquibacillus koreensis]
MINEKIALYGGEPIRNSYLPYGKQWIDEEDIKSVKAALQSDFLTTGPILSKFEEKIARYVKVKHAVAFSSGTAALHAACFAAGIKKGDEVITTPMTFAATSNCILYMGGIPVFADINPQTYNISSKSVKSLITNKTKAIITVDFTGQPAEYEELVSIAEDHGIIIIGDAAHALGASYKGKSVGSITDMTMFSFHPVKHITTGEGGIITTDDDEFYQQLIDFRTHGITRDAKRLMNKGESWYYEMHELGFNYRMTDIQAALGLSQINKLQKFIEIRRNYADRYNKAFKDIDEIIIPFQHEDSNSSWHLYIIRLNINMLKTDRDEIFKALQKENIGVNVHYIPVYLHPYYQELGYEKGLCPQAESVFQEIITLPLFPAMSDNDLDDVIKAVKKVIAYYSFN